MANITPRNFQDVIRSILNAAARNIVTSGMQAYISAPRADVVSSRARAKQYGKAAKKISASTIRPGQSRGSTRNRRP